MGSGGVLRKLRKFHSHHLAGTESSLFDFAATIEIFNDAYKFYFSPWFCVVLIVRLTDGLVAV